VVLQARENVTWKKAAHDVPFFRHRPYWIRPSSTYKGPCTIGKRICKFGIF
jgi:hypothetical protein